MPGSRQFLGEVGRRETPLFLYWCNLLCLKEAKSVPKVSGQVAVLKDIKYKEKRTECFQRHLQALQREY